MKSLIPLLLLLTLTISLGFGVRVYLVKSDSMQPTLRRDHLILVFPQNDCSPYSVVVYRVLNSESAGFYYVTHRVIECHQEWVTTKGDANDFPDAKPVHISQVVGRVVFYLPLSTFVVISVLTLIIGFVLSSIHARQTAKSPF